MALEPNQKAFLAAFEKLGNRSAAARSVGITRQTVWNWERKSPEFAEALTIAEEIAAQDLEDVARKLAAAGSERLLIFLLSHLKPERFGDKLEINLNNLTDDQILRIVEAGRLRNRSS